ncbi:uncharacterized protein LOC141649259 [Silene latifolia]|uniref:uncharacterized protein LOC141649259 n=1 Tax=Silene latifolia TaxID=37657 RepID=UPI003D782E53
MCLWHLTLLRHLRKKTAKNGVILEEVDRHLTWLRGHTPNNGDLTEYYKEVATKIKELEKEVEAGTFKPKGREDILAKAIGKPEHGGRVRGVPDGICITEYFGKAPKKLPTEVERLKETINTLQTQVSNMQSMMVHFWQSGEKPSQELLECFLKGISMSTQGSKSCPSTDGSHSISIQESEEQSHPEPHRKEIPHEEPPSQEKEGWRDCDLSLPGNPNKIVASGLMYMEKKAEFITVHGRSLLNGYKKVEVKKVQSGSENDTLPVPVGDDLIVLIDAKDSYVQWPQNHIHSPSKMEIVMKKKKKNHQRSAPPLVPTILGVEVSSEFK